MELKELSDKIDKIVFHFESDSTVAHKGIPERLKESEDVLTTLKDIPERLKSVEESMRKYQDDKKILKGLQIAYGSVGGIIAAVILVILRIVGLKVTG